MWPSSVISFFNVMEHGSSVLSMPITGDTGRISIKCKERPGGLISNWFACVGIAPIFIEVGWSQSSSTLSWPNCRRRRTI
jgi:hypothetical protein